MISHMDQYEEYKEDSLEKLRELEDDLGDPNLSEIVAGINLEDDNHGRASMEQSLSYKWTTLP